MAFIGKNVIENLTTAMYEDLKIIYREYIQNAADSIDAAIKRGLITQNEALINIEINSDKKYVCVSDNGIGIKAADFEKIMSSIADSTKDRNEEKGFRGIGRLGGISSCEKLVFSGTALGENIESVCEWNAEWVREVLEDQTLNPSAEELVDKATTYKQNVCNAEDHYFKVELINVDDSSYDVLDEKLVKDYLRAVAPLPYDVGFVYTNTIHEFARQNNFCIDEYNVYINGESLFKKYTTKLYEAHNNSKKAYDEIIDVKFEIFRDNEDQPLAWMWYGICKFEKQIPRINSMRGIRLRKANIQIGNESTFSSHGFYKEPRSGLYFIGEVFAVHSGLIPNARRDYFNLNDTCRMFEETLHPLFHDRFYNIYHHANDYKKALQKQKSAVDARSAYDQKVTTGSFINQEERKEEEKKVLGLEETAKKAAKTIETRDTKEGSDDVLGKVYGQLKKDYSSGQNSSEKKEKTKPDAGISASSADKNKYLTQSLSKYTKKEQKLISRIYSILKAILPHDNADIVIQKIQEELIK